MRKFKCLIGLHGKDKYLGPTSVWYWPSDKIKFEDLYECVDCGHQFRLPEGFEQQKNWTEFRLKTATKLKQEGNIDLAIKMLKL